MTTPIDYFERPDLLRKSARYSKISLLQRVYEGKQYEGRPDWWTGKRKAGDEEAPLRERKPCVIYKLPKAAVRQVVNFLFGDKRFPKVSMEVSEGDDGYPALTADEASEISTWLSSAIETAALKPMMQAIAERAISCGSAPVIVELVEGTYRFTLPRAQDCFAEFIGGLPELGVKRLVWCYEYEQEELDPASQNVITSCYMFRREYTEQHILTFEPVKVTIGKPIVWGAPEVKEHGLSFCPVLWIQNEPEYADGIDGISLIADLEDEFEALDMALSRRHQGIIYLGAPQVVETGVEDGDGPDQSGKRAGPPNFSPSMQPGYQVAPKARRIAPDSVWTYQGEKVSVTMLETSGKAFEVGTQHVNDIRSRILESIGVVLTSMADTVGRITTGAEMSGRFLALAHAPLIALVGRYRLSWWPKALRPLLDMMFRMAVEVGAKNEVVSIPGSVRIAELGRRFVVDGKWVPLRMTEKWGRFFDPSSTEVKTSAEAAATAKDKRLISQETGVEYVSHDFGVDSVEDELLEIEADTLKANEAEATVLQRMNGDSIGVPPDSPQLPKSGDSGGSKDGEVNPQPLGN